MRKVVMGILSVMLLIGMFMLIGTVGNLEFADLTGQAGFTESQFWLRIIVGVLLLIGGAVGANKLERRINQ